MVPAIRKGNARPNYLRPAPDPGQTPLAYLVASGGEGIGEVQRFLMRLALRRSVNSR
jgi:hypothetical protein